MYVQLYPKIKHYIPHSLPQSDTSQILKIEYIQKRVEFAGWLCQSY